MTELEIAKENLGRSIQDSYGFAQIAADRLRVKMLEEAENG